MAVQKDKGGQSAQELLARARPPQAAVRVCLRGDLLADYDLVVDDLARHDGWTPGGLDDVDPRPPLLQRKRDLEEQMQAETVEFRFRSVGDRAWSDLLAKHPARDGHDENWDPTSFPAAMIAASAVDPVLTLEDVEAFFDVLTLNQRNTLAAAAFSANLREVDVPFSSGSSGAGAGTAKK